MSSGISGAGRLEASRARAAARSSSRPSTGKVTDQHLVPGRRRADCRRRAGDVGQGLERGVDLAELDPAAAEFDLFVGAADEDQALPFVADQVAGAVGAGPAQGRSGAYFSASLAGSR